MAFTVSFPTSQEAPPLSDIAVWLTAQGEPFEQDGDALLLRALPVRLVLRGGAIHGQLEMTPASPLGRLIQLLFRLSVRIGSDVRLVGYGEVNRAMLWLRLADEQDRLRLLDAIRIAEERGKRETVLRGLWAVLAAVAPERDVRWDVQQGSIVEVYEVGETISLDEAQWLSEDVTEGDLLPAPVQDTLHIVAWRWLSQNYPGLAT